MSPAEELPDQLRVGFNPSTPSKLPSVTEIYKSVKGEARFTGTCEGGQATSKLYSSLASVSKDLRKGKAWR